MKDFNVESLMEDSRWVRGLAFEIARNSADADDLVQEGWIASLRDDNVRNPRSWLRAVMRNGWVSRVRGEKRRRARETSSSRDESVPAESDVLERLEASQIVANAVKELPVHYRTVILLRFYDDRSPAEIARELGVPVATVQTRLARGLERLRLHLESRVDDLRGLLLLVFDLPSRTVASAATTSALIIGGIAVKKLTVAVVALLVVVGVWWGWDSATPDSNVVASSGTAQREDNRSRGDGVPAVTGSAKSGTSSASSGTPRGDDLAELEGHVQLVDASGSLLSFEAMSFDLVSLGETRKSVDVDIVGDAFTARVPREQLIALDDIVIDDERMRTLEPRYALPESGGLVVVVEAVRVHGLRVVDDETGRELEEVFVTRNRQHVTIESLEAHGLVVAGEPSPVEVPASQFQLFVGAPGYAWKMVSVGDRPSDYEVRLDPGGTLEVHLDGDGGGEGWVFVRPADAIDGSLPPVARYVRTSPALLGGLTTGPKRVWVHTDAINRVSQSEASALVEVEAGTVNVVHLERVLTPPAVLVDGVIRVPAGYAPTELSFRPASPGMGAFTREFTEVAPGHFEWSHELTPGEWSVEVHPFVVLQKFTVDQVPARVEVNLPQLLPLAIEIQPPTAKTSSLVAKLADGAMIPSHRFSADASGVFRFVGPPAAYRFAAASSEGWSGSIDVNLDASIDRETLYLDPVNSHGFDVRFMCDGALVPTIGLKLELRKLTGTTPKWSTRSQHGRVRRLFTSEAGEYEVTFGGTMDSYQTPAAQRVQIGPDGPGELTVELLRR